MIDLHEGVLLEFVDDHAVPYKVRLLNGWFGLRFDRFDRYRSNNARFKRSPGQKQARAERERTSEVKEQIRVAQKARRALKARTKYHAPWSLS